MTTTDKVVVGDTMRISVELIRQIDAMPDRSSLIVELVEVRVEDDGSKTLMMKNIHPVEVLL